MVKKEISKAKIIQDIRELPPIPKIVDQLRGLITSPETSAKDIALLIEHDEALTARVIRVCNSAFFGLVKNITSVQHAVTYLGMMTMYNLVLAGAISGLFQRGLSGYKHRRGELWEHSLYTAFCSEFIAKRKGYKNLAQTAFTAGILHDVGKLILNEYLKERMDKIMGLLEDESISWLMAEKRVIGFTHTEVGAAVARKWRFSPELVEPILYHHSPRYCKEHKEIVNITHVATSLALKEGYAVGIDAPRYRLSRMALRYLNMDEDDIKVVLNEMRVNFDPTMLY